jgi:hypothetical protein
MQEARGDHGDRLVVVLTTTDVQQALAEQNDRRARNERGTVCSRLVSAAPGVRCVP